MMSDIQREALGVLAELCELSDDIRLGQLVAWLGDLGEDETGRRLGNIEDEELLAVMYRHRAELVARFPESQKQAIRSSGSAVSIAQGSVVPEAAPSAELGR
ncbi:MAG: hypothetical protein L0228_01635 [Planctomycetes bacterium]|nr:hypothetical protein [Planctomycetota bacterium]